MSGRPVRRAGGPWWQTGSPAPDGTYALLRYDEATIELLSDVIALARSGMWSTDEAFLASTSQRALVALLGDFQLSRPAVSWMLSSGALGPEASWDARLSRLPGCSRLAFDRTTWRARLDDRAAAVRPRGARADGPRREPARGADLELRAPAHRRESVGAAAVRRARQPRAARLHGARRSAAPLCHLVDPRLRTAAAFRRLHRASRGAALRGGARARVARRPRRGAGRRARPLRRGGRRPQRRVSPATPTAAGSGATCSPTASAA